jgi:hypothetical protein
MEDEMLLCHLLSLKKFGEIHKFTIEEEKKIMSHHAISCQQCRSSHMKCDKVLPQCGYCKKTGKTCIYTTPKRNRSKTHQQNKTSSLAVIETKLSNKKIKATKTSIIRDVIVIIPSQEIIQYYLNELNEFWTFIPKPLLKEVMNFTSSSSIMKKVEDQQYTRGDDYEERVKSLLWECILLFAMQHMIPPQPNNNNENAEGAKKKLKDIELHLEQKCESILLQVDIQKHLSEDYRLAWASSFLAFHLQSNEDKLGRSRVWTNTTKVSLDTTESTLTSSRDNDKIIGILRKQYLCLKYTEMVNSFDIGKPYGYKKIYKIVKLLKDLFSQMVAYTEIPDFEYEPTAVEINFYHMMQLLKDINKKNLLTFEQLVTIADLLNGILLPYDCDWCLYNTPDENMKMMAVLTHNLSMNGIVLELLKFEEEKVQTSLFVDRIKLQEIHKIQLSVADGVTTNITTRSSAFLKYGIMQIRPLLFATHVHLQASKRAASEHPAKVLSLRQSLVSDRWILEQLQAKYELPVSAIALLYQLKQQIEVPSNTQTVVLQDDSDNQQTTDYSEFMVQYPLSPLLSDELDISDLLA